MLKVLLSRLKQEVMDDYVHKHAPIEKYIDNLFGIVELEEELYGKKEKE